MLLSFIGFLLGVSATTSLATVDIPIVRDEPLAPIILDFSSTTTIKKYVLEQAKSKNIDEKLVDEIVTCESDYWPQQSKVKDPTGPNGFEDSWGIWQINLPGKNITREQAMDVVWSTDWALSQLKSGFTSWSCYPVGDFPH